MYRRCIKRVQRLRGSKTEFKCTAAEAKDFALKEKSLNFVSSSSEYQKIMSKIATQFRSNVRIWIGPRLLIFLVDPEDVKVSD